MVRTKQPARKATGGKAPVKGLRPDMSRMSAPAHVARRMPKKPKRKRLFTPKPKKPRARYSSSSVDDTSFQGPVEEEREEEVEEEETKKEEKSNNNTSDPTNNQHDDKSSTSSEETFEAKPYRYNPDGSEKYPGIPIPSYSDKLPANRNDS